MTFICVFENVTWYFGFEVKGQMRFVKHTHCVDVQVEALQNGNNLLSYNLIHGLGPARFMCNNAFNLIQLYQLFARPILSYVKWRSLISSPEDVLEGKV
jgi:hypothetical protein